MASLKPGGQLDSAVDHFEIKPGLHTELLTLGGAQGASSAYQYLHVVGEKAVDSPEFGTSSETRNRPQKYVPVRVAVYDKSSSDALKAAQQNGEQSNTDTTTSN